MTTELTVAQAARVIGVDPRTIRYWLSQSRLEYSRDTPRSKYHIPRWGLAMFLFENELTDSTEEAFALIDATIH